MTNENRPLLLRTSKKLLKACSEFQSVCAEIGLLDRPHYAGIAMLISKGLEGILRSLISGLEEEDTRRKLLSKRS